ncbi:MAG: ABC transporter permease [Oscillospiraceae bacterium]|nr:ABC transporter permease [Oscillospiraceae bacterium]
MRISDLLAMCRQNLLRRKGRTVLTSLGVMIGCTAIVIMVSIGVASGESMEVMLQSMGDLTMIEIYGYGQTPLNDDAIDQVRDMDHVVAATAKQYSPFGATLSAGSGGRYEQQWCYMQGMQTSAMEDIGYELLEGSYPLPGTKEIQVVVGQYFAYSFMDTKRPEGRNMVNRYVFDAEGNLDTENIPEAYFDPLGMELKLTVQIDEKKTLEKDLVVVGIMKEDNGRGYETSEGLVMDLTQMQQLQEEITKMQGFAVSREAPKYDNAIVKVDDIENLAAVQDEITSMGYETWSMESIREPMLEETNRQQMVFGGLGAISLFVAAIGIMNTMVMSITERTREIGVMKALGCYVKDIRRIFLLEAGCIGLIGGISGVLISLLISLIMNLVSVGAGGYFAGLMQGMPLSSLSGLWQAVTTPGSRISVVPVWLALAGLGISVSIGVLSGFYPANKAVKIPALEAIKHE